MVILHTLHSFLAKVVQTPEKERISVFSIRFHAFLIKIGCFSASCKKCVESVESVEFEFKQTKHQRYTNSTHFYYLFKKCVESVDTTLRTLQTLYRLSTDSLQTFIGPQQACFKIIYASAAKEKK